jgi:sulfur-oxidizing protein SoxZ
MAKTGTARVRVGSAKQGQPVQVRALILHPMETGLRKDPKTGEKIPAHWVKKVKADYNGERVFEADWSVAISKNPYLSYYLNPGSGGTLKMTWEDNKGGTFTAEAEVKVG